MNWKLALLLICLAFPGVIASSWLAVPLLFNPEKMAVPLETLQAVTTAQGVIAVSLAAVIGTLLANKVGLTAPVISSMVGRGKVIEALRPQLQPALAGGAIGAVLITVFYAFSPESLAAVQNKISMPIAVRVLYGGITEEIITRWGLMTLLVWIGWRIFQGGVGKASGGVTWMAIVIGALLFGASHIPVAAISMSSVPLYAAAYITIGNAAFGIIAGYLFWRHGLEAAIIAHATAHLFAFAVRG